MLKAINNADSYAYFVSDVSNYLHPSLNTTLTEETPLNTISVCNNSHSSLQQHSLFSGNQTSSITEEILSQKSNEPPNQQSHVVL